MSTEKYLRPEVIRQVARLDLRAKFIVEGFLSGLHASPYHGFSVEFSEHRKYVPGDDLKDLDWNVYAKTDKYYLKKFQAETNVTGYLVMDLSRSMAYTYRQELTKFEYAICLAAALGYLMIHQQDPVGLVTFDTRIQASLPPRSKLRPRTLCFDRWTLHVGRRELTAEDGVAVPLSTAEFRLLCAFADHAGMVLSRDELLDLTAGRAADVFDRSIDNQVSRLRRKIETDPRNPTLIKTHWGGGYSFTAEVSAA